MRAALSANAGWLDDVIEVLTAYPRDVVKIGVLGAIALTCAIAPTGGCGASAASVSRRGVRADAPATDIETHRDASSEPLPPPSVSFIAVPRWVRILSELAVSEDGQHIAAITQYLDREVVFRDGVWLGAYEAADRLTWSPNNGRLAYWGVLGDQAWPEPIRWSLIVDGQAIGEDGKNLFWSEILPITDTYPSGAIAFSPDGRRVAGQLGLRRPRETVSRFLGERFEAPRPEPSEYVFGLSFDPRGEPLVLTELDGNGIHANHEPTGLAHVMASSLGFAPDGTVHFMGRTKEDTSALYVDGRIIEPAAQATGVIARTAQNRLGYVIAAGRQQHLVVDDRVRASYGEISFVEAIDRTNSFVFVGADAMRAEVRIVGRPKSEMARAVVENRVVVREDEDCIAYTEIDADGQYFVVTRMTRAQSRECEEERRGPFTVAGIPAFAPAGVAFIAFDSDDGRRDPASRPALTLHLPDGATVPIAPAASSYELARGITQASSSHHSRIGLNGFRVPFSSGPSGVMSTHETLTVRATRDGRLSHLASAYGDLCFVVRQPDDTRPIGLGCNLEPPESSSTRSSESAHSVSTEDLGRVPVHAAVSVSPDGRIAWSNRHETYLGARKLRDKGANCFRWDRDGSLFAGSCREMSGGALHIGADRMRLPRQFYRFKAIDNGGGMVSIHGRSHGSWTLFLPAIGRTLPIGAQLPTGPTSAMVTAHRMGSRERTIATTGKGLYDNARLVASGVALPEVRFSRDDAHYLGVVIDGDLSKSSAIVDGGVFATGERIFPIGFDAEHEPVFVVRQGGSERVQRGGDLGKPYRMIMAKAARLDRTGRHVGYGAQRTDGAWVLVVDDRETPAVHRVPRAVLPRSDGALAWTEQGPNADHVFVDGRLVATAQRVFDDSLTFTGDGKLAFASLAESDGRGRLFLFVGEERSGPFDEMGEVALADEASAGSPGEGSKSGDVRFAFLARVGRDWAFYVNGSRCADTGTPLPDARPRLVGDAATIVVRTSDGGDEVVRLRCALR